MHGYKRKLFCAACKILGVELGERAPNWLLWIFYPLWMMYLRQSHIKYEFEKDLYTIDGIEISGHTLNMWKDSPDMWFRVRKDKNGGFLIETRRD